MIEEYEDDMVISGKIVNGFLEEEYEVIPENDRENYSNYEVSQHLDAYFRFFGKKEMDIVYLYFLSGKKQFDLMNILEKTQPAISYDVNRIKKKIEFVTNLVSFIDEFILFIIDDRNNLTIQERELLLVFFYSTSIVKTSKILNKNNIT